MLSARTLTLQVEGVGALDLLNALELDVTRTQSPVQLLVQHDSHRCCRREVVILVELAKAIAKCAAHREPHDDLGTLRTAQAHVVGVREFRHVQGVVEKIYIPLFVVEAGSLPV
jgi:hypothetical protein